MILEALTRPGDDPAVHRLALALGGDPAVRERRVGEPARRSRRLRFPCGGEIILHDDAVAAVLLHLATPTAPHGINLSAWIAGAENEATLDDLALAFGAAPDFAGIGTPYFALDGAYARCTFHDNRGWKTPGNLVSITFTADKPGERCRPEDDECPTCADLLIRSSDVDESVGAGGIDVGRTIEALTAALSADLLTEDTHWVQLADIQPLYASGLMERVESQLTCASCHRVSCLTLVRDSSPTFGHLSPNEARRRPLDALPPVEQWGDADRVAAEQGAMHYVDHAPGAWFLVEQQSHLYLDARYSYSAVIDDSALIRLNADEVEAYRVGGHDYLSDLAGRIHMSAPYSDKSPYHRRDLYRGPDGKKHRAALGRAIVNHTWIAQHRTHEAR